MEKLAIREIVLQGDSQSGDNDAYWILGDQTTLLQWPFTGRG